MGEDRDMIVRIGIRDPGSKKVDEVTGEGDSYDDALADAQTKVPVGWQQLCIDVER